LAHVVPPFVVATMTLPPDCMEPTAMHSIDEGQAVAAKLAWVTGYEALTSHPVVAPAGVVDSGDMAIPATRAAMEALRLVSVRQGTRIERTRRTRRKSGSPSRST
jgi:hypothetical protein